MPHVPHFFCALTIFRHVGEPTSTLVPRVQVADSPDPRPSPQRSLNLPPLATTAAPPPVPVSAQRTKPLPPSWINSFACEAPLFLTDTERVVLLSCMDVGQGACTTAVSPSSIALPVPPPARAWSAAVRPVLAPGRIAWSKAAVSVSLLGIHVLVGAAGWLSVHGWLP
jgi:hypothetical protein